MRLWAPESNVAAATELWRRNFSSGVPRLHSPALRSQAAAVAEGQHHLAGVRVDERHLDVAALRDARAICQHILPILGGQDHQLRRAAGAGAARGHMVEDGRRLRRRERRHRVERDVGVERAQNRDGPAALERSRHITTEHRHALVQLREPLLGASLDGGIRGDFPHPQLAAPQHARDARVPLGERRRRVGRHRHEARVRRTGVRRCALPHRRSRPQHRGGRCRPRRLRRLPRVPRCSRPRRRCAEAAAEARRRGACAPSPPHPRSRRADVVTAIAMRCTRPEPPPMRTEYRAPGVRWRWSGRPRGPRGSRRRRRASARLRSGRR